MSATSSVRGKKNPNMAPTEIVESSDNDAQRASKSFLMTKWVLPEEVAVYRAWWEKREGITVAKGTVEHANAEGKVHIHVGVTFKGTQRKGNGKKGKESGLCKVFPGWDIRPCSSNQAFEHFNYATKDVGAELFIDIDNREPGKRSDLLQIQDKLKQGATVDSLRDEHFGTVLRNERALQNMYEFYNKIEDVRINDDDVPHDARVWMMTHLLNEDGKSINMQDAARRIDWIYDPIGNFGKSIMGQWLEQNTKTVYFDVGMKTADVQQHAINWIEEHRCFPDCLYIDLPRGALKHFNSQVFEALKNGRYHATKWKGKSYWGPRPRMVIATNDVAEQQLYSEDKLVFFQVSATYTNILD